MAAQKFAFNVIGQVTNNGWEFLEDTNHYRNERAIRTETIEKFIGFGNDVLSFVVDTKHPNGLERHVLTDTGIIKIYNDGTHKHINDLIARPAQIKRYFKDGYVPNQYKYLLNKARHNQECGYNEV